MGESSGCATAQPVTSSYDSPILGGVILWLFLFFIFIFIIILIFLTKKFFRDSTETVRSNDSLFEYKVKHDKLQCPMFFGGDRYAQF